MQRELDIHLAQLAGSRQSVSLDQFVHDVDDVKIFSELELMDDQCCLMILGLAEMSMRKLLVEGVIDPRRETHLLHVVKDDITSDVLELAEGEFSVLIGQDDLSFLELKVEIVDDDPADDEWHLLI